MAKISTALFGDLAILPHPAETPIKETLEFLTNVLESQNSTEERLQLRSKARQSFAYSVPVQAWNMAAFFNTEFGAIRKKWAVPVWTEGQYIGTVAAAASSIACDTTIFDLRENSLALLIAGCDNWQIVEIGSIDDDSIEVTNDLEAIARAWLFPVRLGWVVGNIDKPTNGHNGKTTIAFDIEDNLALSPDAPSQYLSEDIYFESGLLSGNSIARTIEQRQDIADFDLGPVARRSPWTNARFGTPYRSIIKGPAAVREYREFLFRRAGKFRAFYMPTFENNLRVANTGTIVSTLLVQSDSFIDYATIRENIALQTMDGNWLTRGVSNPVQLDPNRVQLTLSAAVNVAPSNIARVSYLGLNRMNTDRIELTWIGNNVVESQFQILEIKP